MVEMMLVMENRVVVDVDVDVDVGVGSWTRLR